MMEYWMLPGFLPFLQSVPAEGYPAALKKVQLLFVLNKYCLNLWQTGKWT